MRLYIVVEGKSEETFVDELLRPYFNSLGFYDVTPVKIQTSKGFKGGFVSYQHLKNDVTRLLHQNDVVVTTFVDFFRIPTSLPNYAECMKQANVDAQIDCLTQSIKDDMGYSDRFLPYIQKHEFESLLFSSSKVYATFYDESVVRAIERIIGQYDNPEDINNSPATAPSKRILSLIKYYNKVNDGNLIALEIGIDRIIEQCPRFAKWILTIREILKI